MIDSEIKRAVSEDLWTAVTDVTCVCVCVCRIYERVVEIPYMDIPEDASFWLGQRNAAHGFFKVRLPLRKNSSENINVCVWCMCGTTTHTQILFVNHLLLNRK